MCDSAGDKSRTSSWSLTEDRPPPGARRIQGAWFSPRQNDVILVNQRTLRQGPGATTRAIRWTFGPRPPGDNLTP
jgi:hypothetical protein